MSTPSAAERLMVRIGRQFSEAQLRRAVQRELPELLPELPGPGGSLGRFVYELVQAAERRRYMPDLEVLVASLERRASSSRLILFGGLALACAGVFLAGRAAREVSQDGGVVVESSAPPEVEPRKASMADEPETRPLSAPVTASRSAPARRKPAVPAPITPAPVASAPVREDARPDGSQEPSSGRAECRGWSCRLRADSGQFHRSEEFCVVPPGDSEVKRCIIHGALIHPAPTVECDLSEAPLTGEMRWRRCHGAL